MHKSIALEREALASMNRQDYGRAVSLLSRLVEDHPSYEHGKPHYDLACCFEELGQFDEARASFVRALEANPTDPIFSGGYASFLYQHGTAQDAFDAYVRFIAIVGPQSELGQRSWPAVIALAEKLGIGEQEAQRQIREVEETCARPNK